MKFRKLLVLLLLVASAFILSACAGEQGLQGEAGDKGPKGETGAPGETGKAGNDGVKGADGENGADGSTIEFSFTSDGLAWRYVDENKWNTALTYESIFTAMEETKLAEKVQVIKPDYYVSASLKAEAGAEVEAYGLKFVAGTSAFDSIPAAFAAAKAAAAVDGYAGLKIFVAPGYYLDEATLEADKVAIYGPNFDAEVGASRLSEAEIAAPITIMSNDVEISGCMFSDSDTTKGVIVIGAYDVDTKATSPASVDNFKFNHNYVTASPVAYDSSAQCNRKGFIFAKAVTKNLTVSENYVDLPSLYLGSFVTLPVDANNFTFVKNYVADDSATSTTNEAIMSYYLSGVCTIADNHFVWITSNWTFSISYNSNTCSEVNITGNVFEGADNALTCGFSIRALSATTVVNFMNNKLYNMDGTIFSAASCKAGSTINIMYNFFDTDAAWKASASDATFVTNYNAYNGGVLESSVKNPDLTTETVYKTEAEVLAAYKAK